MVTQSEVQHIISERMKELQELKHNVDVLKVRSDKICFSARLTLMGHAIRGILQEDQDRF